MIEANINVAGFMIGSFIEIWVRPRRNRDDALPDA